MKERGEIYFRCGSFRQKYRYYRYRFCWDWGIQRLAVGTFLFLLGRFRFRQYRVCQKMSFFGILRFVFVFKVYQGNLGYMSYFCCKEVWEVWGFFFFSFFSIRNYFRRGLGWGGRFVCLLQVYSDDKIRKFFVF